MASLRSTWKVRLGWVLWAVVAVLALFEIANRMWLDWYHVSEFQTQDRWHDLPKAPAFVAVMALAYFGVWWESGRIDQTWQRRTVRIAWIVTPILALAVLVYLQAAFAGRALT